MKKLMLPLCLAVALILHTQAAEAGTRIYVNLGLPVVYLHAGDWGPSGNYIWIEGHYSMGCPGYVWVPGYWAPARHYHQVCTQRPQVHYHYHGTMPRYSSGRPGPGHHHGHIRDGARRYSDASSRPRQSLGGHGYATDRTWITNVRGAVTNRHNQRAR